MIRSTSAVNFDAASSQIGRPSRLCAFCNISTFATTPHPVETISERLSESGFDGKTLPNLISSSVSIRNYSSFSALFNLVRSISVG